MKRKEIIISSILLVVIIGIYSAYTLVAERKKRSLERDAEIVEIYKPVETEFPSDEVKNSTESIYYIVKSNEDLLELYEVNGESKRTLKSFNISPEMFPHEDRELLRTGIKALTLEEGIKIIENFIS